MAPADAWPRSHYDILHHYHAQYDRQIKAGEFEPFIYPWGTFGALIVIIYLLVPHRGRPWLQKARFLAFAWIAGFAAYSVRYTRAKNMAPAFGLGIVSAWSVIWLMAILVVNDAQIDFQRIERMEGAFRRSSQELDTQNGTMAPASEKHDKSQRQNGVSTNGLIERKDHLGPAKRHGEFAWQPYPLTPFVERLDWVLDIFCNFKGMGWNWRISTLPPPPKHIQEQLYRNSTNPPKHSTSTHLGQTHVYATRREVLVAAGKSVVTGYIILDVLKTIVNHDPYFWGLVHRPPPSYFPSVLTNSSVLTRMYRLTVSQLLIKTSLQCVFSLAPLAFSGLLGPSTIGARAEHWMYPEEWGSYSVVLDRGLAGWWSGWWHQTFQFAFKEPSRKIVELLGMDKRSPQAKALQLFVAFGLSGTLHACGSYTQPGITRPLLGPLRFFLLQALGIFIEVSMSEVLRKTGIQNRLPRWFMRTFTFLYVNLWFYHTAGLLVDDFAKGGIWLYEPIPFSLLRGFGFGVEGDRFWNWGGEWYRLVRGQRWWNSGIAF
ncbi:membrane bound O-acyl transferase family-domain-containing protein [Lophiotrema nucula]|uniref:Membrane bound O-acyl transferase family-domain-containing protein n=1 Tax=Lophiotrema nucula TaxID=690887 RepID=A0A6A5Z9Q5_9PLEO|nr:membrane bound O-acyl transferase family-domain-containing protein [Lophiotrema nucula]